MEKLISLAQVEQLIDEMMNQRENALHSIWNDKYLQDSRTRINWEKRTLERLKSKLSSLPTEESRWIAMSERLPDRDDWQEYLVSSKDSVTTMHWNDYEQVWMKNKRIHVWDQSLFWDVIAWQVLPKSPLQ